MGSRCVSLSEQSRRAVTSLSQITKMQNIFVGVDIDRNGTLDLAEFLCMMFSWGASGEKFDKIFGGCMENALVVDHAFRIMSMAWAKYDSDRSQALEYSELIGFLKAELPDAFSFATAVVDEIYPESIRSVCYLPPPPPRTPPPPPLLLSLPRTPPPPHT
eukprot:756509-Hanusia_phi.AAC.5